MEYSCAPPTSDGCTAASAGGRSKINQPPPASRCSSLKTRSRKARSASASVLKRTTWEPKIICRVCFPCIRPSSPERQIWRDRCPTVRPCRWFRCRVRSYGHPSSYCSTSGEVPARMRETVPPTQGRSPLRDRCLWQGGRAFGGRQGGFRDTAVKEAVVVVAGGVRQHAERAPPTRAPSRPRRARPRTSLSTSPPP